MLRYVYKWLESKRWGIEPLISLPGSSLKIGNFVENQQKLFVFKCVLELSRTTKIKPRQIECSVFLLSRPRWTNLNIQTGLRSNWGSVPRKSRFSDRGWRFPPPLPELLGSKHVVLVENTFSFWHGITYWEISEFSLAENFWKKRSLAENFPSKGYKWKSF